MTTRGDHRVYRLVFALLAGVALLGTLAALLRIPGSGTGARPWSATAVLARCPGEGAPAVAFPANSPAHRTGDAMLAWEQGRTCAHGQGLRMAALDAHDLPGSERVLADPPSDGHTGVELTGAGAGRVLMSDGGALREAWGREDVDAPHARAASAVALATAYRGQAAALYALPTGRGSALLLRRSPSQAGAAKTTRVAITAAPIGALAVALDYRTEGLGVWQQGANVYARWLPRSSTEPRARVQRLGSAGTWPALTALISDDGRAIVAWLARERKYTRVYAAVSAPGVRFVAPHLLESYPNPHGSPPPDGSLRVIRLSSERVLLAWPGVEQGRYVVRVAHVALSGVQRPLTISAPRGAEALPTDLAPGNRQDALLAWTQAPAARATRAPAGQELFAAYGSLSAAGRPRFGAPEAVAASVAAGEARVAFDPDSDRAIAIWRAADGSLARAVREPGAANM
jgi:hypothetical protein